MTKSTTYTCDLGTCEESIFEREEIVEVNGDLTTLHFHRECWMDAVQLIKEPPTEQAGNPVVTLK